MTSEIQSLGEKPAPARRGTRFRRAAVAAGLAAGVALLCAAAGPASAATASAPGSAAAAGATGHVTASASDASSAAKRVIAYWTKARMLSARNGDGVQVKAGPAHAAAAGPRGRAGHVAGTAADEALAGPGPRITAQAVRGARPDVGAVGSPWTGNAYAAPATTTGKVFFSTANHENWVCSGSTVNSNGRDSVITAGHCVFGSLGGEVPGEGWHSNWVFVPDYSNGSAPYGVWTAKELWAPTAYVNNQDEGDDMGGAVLNTNAYGQHIVSVVGGQGFAWNWAADQAVYDFGYPAAAPFNGQTLQYCNGSEFNWSSEVSSTMGLACNFTGGSSGGPWLMDFGGSWGYINGVNDFAYSSLPGYIFSAYFGNNADSLYNAMANL